MNIFVLDVEPNTAARYHCDKHLSKMQLETAQLLSAALQLPGATFDSMSSWCATEQPALYKLSHKHHPCTTWLRSKPDNFAWLCQLATALDTEWQMRGHRPHLSYTKISAPIAAHASQHGAVLQLTPLPFCAGELTWPLLQLHGCSSKHNDLATTVQLYRSYYCYGKHSFAKWPLKLTPEWWQPACLLPGKYDNN